MRGKAHGMDSPILLWMLSHGIAWLSAALQMETAARASSGVGATAMPGDTQTRLFFWDSPL